MGAEVGAEVGAGAVDFKIEALDFEALKRFPNTRRSLKDGRCTIVQLHNGGAASQQ